MKTKIAQMAKRDSRLRTEGFQHTYAECIGVCVLKINVAKICLHFEHYQRI